MSPFYIRVNGFAFFIKVINFSLQKNRNFPQNTRDVTCNNSKQSERTQ